MQPVFELNNSDLFKNSVAKNIILEKTPFMSGYISSTIDTIEDVNYIIKNKRKYKDKEFNCEITNIMLKNKIVEKESLDYLYSTGKLKYKCK